MADLIMERESTKFTEEEPDDVDTAMLGREVAEEHQRLRSKFVHRQGGFLKEDESPVVRLDEDEGGPASDESLQGSSSVETMTTSLMLMQNPCTSIHPSTNTCSLGFTQR